MSEPWHPPSPDPGLSGCLTGLMILVGVVLLLPGICAAGFAVGFVLDPQGLFRDAGLWLLWLASLAVAGGGIALIWWAVRRSSS